MQEGGRDSWVPLVEKQSQLPPGRYINMWDAGLRRHPRIGENVQLSYKRAQFDAWEGEGAEKEKWISSFFNTIYFLAGRLDGSLLSWKRIAASHILFEKKDEFLRRL